MLEALPKYVGIENTPLFSSNLPGIDPQMLYLASTEMTFRCIIARRVFYAMIEKILAFSNYISDFEHNFLAVKAFFAVFTLQGEEKSRMFLYQDVE